MSARLVQFRRSQNTRSVGLVRDNKTIIALTGVESTVALAERAIEFGRDLEDLARELATGSEVAYQELVDEGHILAPIDAADPAHCLVTGTGLTHLGSAATRDAMHREDEAQDEPVETDIENLTDSMKMFRMGLDGGKPEPGAIGVQPEWFYKGDGSILVGTGADLVSPGFALDGGEEPEIAGIYLIAADGTPRRIGYALANEFSDHVTERQNYLYLAHSKLRPCAIGPELLLGELPRDIRGTSRIIRKGDIIWQKPFLSGEDNMSHSIANLETHHFKYPQFRRSGDIHIHMFGTATLSFADGIHAAPGDIFEIEAPEFGRPLQNSLSIEDWDIGPARPL